MQNLLALAFSGGLDTSYCVPRLAEQGARCTPSTSTPAAPPPRSATPIRRQAQAVGAVEHHEVDARAEVFDRFVRYLIQGNVLRGEVYPLSVAAERTQQAISVIEVARQIGAAAVAHGSTGAGNDQVRFDVALRVLAPDLADPHADPRRGPHARRRRSHTSKQRGLPVPPKAGAYSINRGSLGHDLGRRLDPRHLGRPAGRAARAARRRARAPRDRHRLGAGLPVSLDGAGSPAPS